MRCRPWTAREILARVERRARAAISAQLSGSTSSSVAVRARSAPPSRQGPGVAGRPRVDEVGREGVAVDGERGPLDPVAERLAQRGRRLGRRHAVGMHVAAGG